jgi:hypothetical protein
MFFFVMEIGNCKSLKFLSFYISLYRTFFLADYWFDFIRKKKLSPDKITLNLTRSRNQNPHHPA